MTDHKPIKTVSIIGLGAIGSFFAFQLKAVLGYRLRIIAGGERKDRLEREGVTVNGVNHHFHIVSPDQDCGGDYPDLAIIITKFPALSQAIKDMKNQIGPDTLIMAPLNGVEAEDMVASVYGWDNLLYSLAKVSVVMKDGQASFKPDAARIEFGEKRNQVITRQVSAVWFRRTWSGPSGLNICAMSVKTRARPCWAFPMVHGASAGMPTLSGKP